jgi:hypothetical protein
VPRKKKQKSNFPTFISIKNGSKNPKSKTRLVIDILLVLMVIGVLGLIWAENSRHNKVQKSAEGLKSSLESRGIRISEVSTDCSKGSRGKQTHSFHKCTLGFTHRVREITIDQANNTILKVNESVADIKDFNKPKSKQFALLDENGRGLRGPSVKLEHKTTGVKCTLYYDSELSSYPTPNIVDFDLILTCDDDSWFNKTFRN